MDHDEEVRAALSLIEDLELSVSKEAFIEALETRLQELKSQGEEE